MGPGNGKRIYLPAIRIRSAEREVNRSLDGERVVVRINGVAGGLVLIHTVTGADTGLAVAKRMPMRGSNR